jgi:hypothetical protein
VTIYVVVVRGKLPSHRTNTADPQWHIDLAFTSAIGARTRKEVIEADSQDHEAQVWKTTLDFGTHL